MNDTASVVSKIRKLLALARDKAASENEAAVAMGMASKLMLEHNIADIGTEDVHDIEIVWGQYGDDWKPWAIWVAVGVSKLYRCKVVQCKDRGHVKIKFVGQKLNIQACEVTLPFIMEQIDRLYKLELARHRGMSKAQRCDLRESFKQACAHRVLHRCGEIAMKHHGEIPSHLALVVCDTVEKKIEAAMSHVKKGRAVSIRSGSGSASGWAAGDQVRLQGEVK